MIEENYFAFMSGLCAAGGSFFGKLFGNTSLSENLFMGCIYFVIMILMNATMWTFFAKALSLSKTSVGPTVASAATNYLLSGVLGIFIFGETTSLLSWSGTFLVLLGLILISRGNQKQHRE